MTALKEALREAGFEYPHEKLRRFAVEAWAAYRSAASSEPRRKYVTEALRHDPTYVLVNMVNPNMMPQAIGFLLNRTAQEIAAEAAKNTKPSLVGGGQILADTQDKSAPTKQSPDHDAATQSEGEQASCGSIPMLAPPAYPTLSDLADKQAARAKDAIATMARLTRLDTFKINGVPIGSCTAGQVRAWAASRKRDSQLALRDERIAMALSSNIPSGDIIRDYWKDEAEIDKVFARAEAEYAA